MISEGPDTRRSIEHMGHMADDFMLAILELKARDSHSLALPFLHAHALELSGKCAILSCIADKSLSVVTHRLRDIYRRISEIQPEFFHLIPSEDSFVNYRTLWIPAGTDNPVVNLPPPDLLDEYEVCFFIENIVDLKYGVDKKMEVVSQVQISHSEINEKFSRLFSGARRIYSTAELDARVLARGRALFGNDVATDLKLKWLFGIAG